MSRIIGDEIEFDGIVIARLIPGAGWPSLIDSFAYFLEYADDLDTENDEQAKKIEALEKKVADLEAQADIDAEACFTAIHEWQEKNLSLVARLSELDAVLIRIIDERERANRAVHFLETVIAALTE